MPPKPRVLLLTGAPPAASVTPDSCTINTLGDIYQAFIDPAFELCRREPSSDGNPSSHAAWRSLTNTTCLPLAGFSQTHVHVDTSRWSQQPSHFFNTLSLSHQISDPRGSPLEEEAVLNQFCEQSLAHHHHHQGAAGPHRDKKADDTTIDCSPTASSFGTDPSGSYHSSRSPSSVEKPMLHLPSHLSDLEDVPSPEHVLALYPQTITLNLIVGVISIAQPKSVTTRWGQALSLVEVLVGDETKAGFAVTFWLSNNDRKADHQSKGNQSKYSGKTPSCTISELRKQDVVLLQNVALHVFRDKVYGQSLRGGWTKVDVLWRKEGGGYYSTRALHASTHHPQQSKTKRVKQWVLDSVGGDPRTRKGKTKTRKSWDEPPDDTG